MTLRHVRWMLLIMLGVMGVGFMALGLALGAAMKKAKDAPFPFGPALSLAGWLTALCGGPVVSWYLSLF